MITSDEQVQIYEELTRDAARRFTTSFIRRDHEVKDNRLLPAGWTATGPDPSLNGVFLDATYPKGDAEHDPDYRDGKGSDRVTYRIELPPDVDPKNVSVRAALLPEHPAVLPEPALHGGKGDATKRLYYLASNLNLATRRWKAGRSRSRRRPRPS